MNVKQHYQVGFAARPLFDDGRNKCDMTHTLLGSPTLASNSNHDSYPKKHVQVTRCIIQGR